MKKDLHIHSKWSDGEYSIKKIVEEVIRLKIREFAITDHDTIKGAKQLESNNELISMLKRHRIKHHSGVELSGTINNRRIHLLGFDFDVNNKELSELSQSLFNARKEKLKLMLEYLNNEFNIVLTSKSIDWLNKVEGSVGRPHLAEMLTEEGYATSKTDAIKRYLAGFQQFNKKDAPAKEIIDTIHNAGGICVLAHPREIMNQYKLEYSDIDEMLQKLIEYGLDGLEVKHSINSPLDDIVFDEMAERYNLYKTYGSDFHGPKTKPSIVLGEMTDDIA